MVSLRREKMAVKIRLSRIGKKKQPYYKIVVTDSRKSTTANYIEQVGTYNPNTDPSDIKLNKRRVKYWLEVGAQPSETVSSILKSQDLL